VGGSSPSTENKPEQIIKVLDSGYDVEIDVWLHDGEYWLGHDAPTYQVDESFLKNKKLWCHAKNLQALEGLSSLADVHFFWHQKDDYTLTSDGYVWCYPGREVSSNSICVMPEKANYTMSEILQCAGVCTDYPNKYTEEGRK
jgi:hypothetical protein